MIRKKAASITDKKNIIRWRSHEPTRLETFSDAVFAFAVTLIIVSLEVPKTFDELFETMKGFVSFAACFGLLFLIWNSQNIFFRRFGLADSYITFLNGVLLFMVLIYAYPLKFLFTLVFSADGTYLDHGQMLPMIKEMQVPTLMYIYDAGYIIIYMLFYFMYRHAKNKAAHLELTEYELFETQTQMNVNLLSAMIGLIGIIATFVLPDKIKGTSGFIYFLIPLVYFIWFTYRSRKSKKIFGVSG